MSHRITSLAAVSGSVLLSFGTVAVASGPDFENSACAFSRYQWIDDQIGSDDGQGHGPDIGSAEWRSVIEFRLGLREVQGKPDSGSLQWCDWIETALHTSETASHASPSFSCDEPEPGSSEALICTNPTLSELDRELSRVYAVAINRAGSAADTLRAVQRGWIRGRDDCWKAEDQAGCIDLAYRRRIAALEAEYALVPHSGLTKYVCTGDTEAVYEVVFYQTEPATLIAEHSGQTSLMYQQPSASGARYAGRNESLWEHQGEAMIVWGFDAPEQRCRKVE